jgi:hypothetical protein
VVAGVAAFVAWLGASVIVLGDGRRALALGVLLATAGMAVIGWQNAGPVAGIAIAAGGAVAAGRRVVSGPEGWRIMPPGSTPRLVLCIASGLVVLWIAAAVTTGPGVSLRFTVMLVAGLMGARVLAGEDPPVLLTATSVLALAVALPAVMGDGSVGPWPYIAAAVIAGTVGWLPLRTARAA